MLKRNTKYTALEILKAAGFDRVTISGETPEAPVQEFTTEQIFGKFSVNIGGIAGIVDPSKVILVSPGTEKLVVVSAGTAKEVELFDGEEEHALSAGVKEAREAAVPEAEKVEVRVDNQPQE